MLRPNKEWAGASFPVVQENSLGEFRLFRPDRENRRNSGVNRMKHGCPPKESPKILLTQNVRWKILPVAPVTAFPPEVRSDGPLLSARRTKSARSTGVFPISKRDDE